MDDDSLPFVEVLEEHIHAWEEAAKVCEKNVLSVELGGVARHSAKEEAANYRGRIVELKKVIEFLRNDR